MAATEIGESTQYLTFTLDEELFALDIAKVREVLDYTSITKVPQTPDFMRGVINLRGSVVPVVDMRSKFNMPVAETTVNTCIIIVEVDIDGEGTVLGAMADSVQEVLELEEKGQANPAVAEGLPGYVAFFNDLCRVQCSRAAGEVGRICAELVNGYNRHPAWGDHDCQTGASLTFDDEDCSGFVLHIPQLAARPV